MCLAIGVDSGHGTPVIASDRIDRALTVCILGDIRYSNDTMTRQQQLLMFVNVKLPKLTPTS